LIMKRILLRGFGLAICLALALSLILPVAVMADALPCNFVGTARIDGEPVSDGTPITAYALKLATAEMDQVGSTLTVSDPAAGFYELVIELDTATHLPEIYFKIGDLWADETATWVQYGLVEINLTTTTGASTTPEPPTTPSSPSPADGATNVTMPVTLSVLVSDPNGDVMTVIFYDASDDSIIATATDVVSGSRAAVSWTGLESGTQYNWYATACDDGALCTTSATWSFTTKTAAGELPTPPIAPSSPSPADGATNVTMPVTLSVLVSDPNGDAMTVTFYDASDDSVIGTAVDVASGSRVSISWTGLALGTQYNWYATACDAGALCTTSATWSFTTTLESQPSCGVPVGFPWYMGGGILLALVVVAIVLAKKKRQSS
jgi:hypothetical protein